MFYLSEESNTTTHSSCTRVLVKTKKKNYIIELYDGVEIGAIRIDDAGKKNIIIKKK